MKAKTPALSQFPASFRRGRTPNIAKPEHSPQIGQIWRLRNGERARIVCVNRHMQDYPIVMLVGPNEDPWSCTSTGEIRKGEKHDFDLSKLYYEPELTRGFVNVYQEGQAFFHRSREEAAHFAMPGLVASIEVIGMSDVPAVRRNRKRGTKKQAAATPPKRSTHTPQANVDMVPRATKIGKQMLQANVPDRQQERAGGTST